MSNQDRPHDRQQEQATSASKAEPAFRSEGSQPNHGGPDKTGSGNAGSTAGAKTAGEGISKQKLKEDAREAKQEVGARVREKAEAGQRRIADGAGDLSDAIDAAAANLDEHDRDGLARYARQMSSKLEAAAGQLEGRSVDQLADDAKRLARDNPALFMLGSVAIGFALSRFFKASEKHDHHDSDDTYRTSQQNNDVTTAPTVHRPNNGTTNPYATPAASRSGNGRDTL